MANWFVDTTLGTGNDDGTTMDDAWQSIGTALAYASFSAGDIIWIRRPSSLSSVGAAINATFSGTLKDWIQFVGCPREELTFNATFTNGSTTVSIDSGLTADWEQHVGRKIKNDADGKWYIITNVDSGDFIIDREFASSTASNGASTIEEDEHYNEFDAIDDAAWTIKVTDWQGDNDDLPLIDFEATAYYYALNSDYMGRFVGLRFSGGTYSNGSVYIRSVSNVAFKYCLWDHDQSSPCVGFNTDQIRAYFDQCVMKGNSTGAAQQGILITNGNTVIIENSAIYGMGDYGINVTGAADLILNNVNIGVEVANGDDDVSSIGPNDWNWKDVKLGGTNGDIVSGLYYRGSINIENNNKVFGAHKCWYNNGTIEKTAVVLGSGDPEKRSGGADEVIAVTQDQSDNSRVTLFDQAKFLIAEFLVWADTSSYTYRFYVQADSLAVTDADEFYVEAEYDDVYDDTSEYHMIRTKSDETITARTGADDWSQYIEVAAQRAVAGWVRLRIYSGLYDADGTLYVDPLMVVS